MNAPRKIPENVLAEQRRASDPGVSAWVSANAGSGKTHVLAQRVISLLLKGNNPATILCITFTKAAAANMASRVFKTLSEWTLLDDGALDEKIRETNVVPDAAVRARARRLFALALETPGGLKVQTIHAFCTRLLHQFPFEADVAARFTVLEDATERQLLEQMTLEVMLQGAADTEAPLGRALQTAIRYAADQTLQAVIMDAIAERSALMAWVDKAGNSVPAAIAQLSAALGVGDGETPEEIDARILAESPIAASEWQAIADILATSEGKTDRGYGKILACMAGLDAEERLKQYCSIFCTDEMKARSRILSKGFADSHPDLDARFRDEQKRICALIERKNATVTRDKSAALLTLAHAVLTRYRAAKDRRALLDYDDLIDKTLTLFRRTSAAWVLYKLDLGINHVLVDEAQDTSPAQWEIIRTLVGEFTAGVGARAIKRTLFAVGDDKQSIFSFQGADPATFAAMASEFAREFREAGLAMEPVQLRASFRSGEFILGAVDAVFARPQAYQGLTADLTGTVHQHLPETAPGCVDIWPLVMADPREKPEGWDAPFDTHSETSQQVRLARRIANNVRLWRANGTKAGTILILVRQRGLLFEAILRALKKQDIPVAGADRLALTEHIAVMDLIVLADALLLPQDDLALATILKSPLFDFSEDDLFALASDRGSLPLRAALRKRADRDPKFASAAQQLDRLAQEARHLSPFAFYANLLGPHGGRRQILSRLGPEANDAIDEFLNLALTYESRETPSLQGFVSWLRAAQAEVKRDMEQDRDEVRVMTVHGAKGLEAPIVILADTTTRPAGYHPPRLLPLAMQGNEAIVWTGRKDFDPAPVADAREKEMRASEDEYRRLLYVAMTRAEKRLIVCGATGKPKKDGTPPLPDGCWYQLIEDALVNGATPLTEEIAADDGEGTIRRFLKSQPPEAAQAEAQPDAETAPPPDWVTRNATPERPRLVIVRPSDADEDDGEVTSVASPADSAAARRRGVLVHRLIQSLPDIVPEKRDDAAAAFLARGEAKKLDDTERSDITAQVFELLDSARFAPLFAEGSRAEVPVVGLIARGSKPPFLVSGQIDRLRVTPEEVLIADYKTNRPAPANLDEALVRFPQYVRQLALYRAVLRLIYPDRAVRAALIFTQTAQMMEIPASALDAQIATLTSS